MARVAAMVVAVAIAVSACQLVDVATPSPEPARPTPTADLYDPTPVATLAGPTADPSLEPTATPPPPPAEGWIGVRVVDGHGEFYDTRTGQRFVPRGMNYNRFLPAGSRPGLADNVFTTRYYDPATIDADLAEMVTHGYNTLRVMIDVCDPVDGCIARGPSTPELDMAYIDNLVDFLRRARDHGLPVMIASNTLPDDSFWLNATGRLANDEFQSANNEFLNPRAVPLYIDYWTEVVRALIERGAPTEVIWSYQLRQEHHFQAAFPPFTLTTGTVTTANGVTYDMLRQEEKDRMLDEGLVHWADVLRSAIREVHPGALVTVGFFVPNEPNPVMDPTDTRLVRTAYFLRNATVDFVDLHHYSGDGVDDAHIWENFGIAGAEAMPLVLGEYGAFRGWWPGLAATALMGMEVGACRVGFDGFLLWAWRGDDARDIWWATDGEREIARALSPVERPDPCQYGELDFVRYNVNDGRPDLWNAAERAPGFVELALARPADLDEIVLHVAQDPPGPSVHQLWVRQAGGRVERVHVFRGMTRDGDVLSYRPPTPLRNVDLVRVVTRELGDLAPAWYEIELLSSSPPE